MAKKKVELSQEEKNALAAIENGSTVEESEQLDELSKATLGSYVKKASDSAIDNAEYAVTNRNYANIARSKGDSDNKNFHMQSSIENTNKMLKRRMGIKKAVNRLTKESEESLDEGMKLIKTHEKDNKTAKVYKNSELGEYKVKHYTDGKHHTKADYHTDDLNDAHGTAKVFLNKKHVEEQEMTKIDETAAHDSLKPNSHPAENPASKVETMKAIIGHLAGMTSDELTKLWDETLSVSKSRVANAKDNSASNRASVSMKPSDAVKEELSVIFDGQELSEDFKDRATTLFEAAVQMTLTTEIARLEEEFETKLAEEIEKSVSEVTESVEKYLDYVAEQFIEENKIAIESTLRAELAETFVEKIRAVFEESHIDLPLEKVDVVEEQNLKIASLEESLNKAIEKITALQEQLVQVDKEKVFAEVSEGLVLTQVDKFKKLAEAISFDGDLDSYKGKLELVKENFVTKEESKKPAKIDLNESVEEENKPIYENSMTKLAKAIKLSR